MNKYFFVLFFLPILAFSQNFDGEDYMYLKRHEHIKVDLKDNAFHIVQDIHEHGKFLTSKNLFYANESIGYSSFSKIEDITAYTYIPESNKTLEVDYIETQQQFDNMVFYSDDEYKTFTFPGVKAGAETHLKYKRIITEPQFLGSFNFAIHVPTKLAQLKIEFPKNVEIGYKEYNTENIELEFNKKETANSIIYIWNAHNTEGFEGEEDSETPMYYLPHIVLYIKNYEKDSQKVGVSGTLEDLYQWYVSLVEQTDEKNLSKVYKIADDITKGMNSDYDKAKTIFKWVQDNISYVAFGDGYGGFIPAGAAATCDTRYGDCKAMSNVLYEMLNHKGIEAYRTWIGTRKLPYSYFDMPTTSVDNHMITTAVIENDTIFLDATDSYIPFGMPSAFIQNKEGLIGINSESFHIIKVPAQEASLSETKVETGISIDQNVLRVNEKRLLTGYDKVEFITDYLYKKDSKTDEEYLNTSMALGNNKTKYLNFTKSNFDNSNAALELSYDLEIASYIKTIGNKIYINPNIDKSLSKSDIDLEDRNFNKKIDYHFNKQFNTTIDVPDGFNVSYVPKELSFEDPNFGFNINYEVRDKKIVQTKSIYVKTLSIEAEDFEKWNSFIKSLRKAYKKSIILEQG